VASGRVIVHLDLDAFYASVEQLDDPSLRGRPVVVAGPSRRGVVCAASYEARRFGVRSAMPTARARRLCPAGVFLAPRFPRYSELSARVFAIYRRTTPLVEPLSLDEAFLDVTASARLHGSGRDIALAVKGAVRREVGLTVSAGVASVKLAAKIASDLGKPDGLVEVPAGAAATRAFLAPLPVSRLWGVGKVTEGALTERGVHRIGQLADAPEALLAGALGERHARALRALARGEDAREVIPDEEAKSIGSEETFDRDITTSDAILPRLREHCERVARRLRAARLRGRTVTVKVKYADFDLATRRVTLGAPTDDGAVIYEAARAQLARVDLDRPVRLAGVAVSGLGREAEQLGLFEPRPDPDRRARLNAALDELADRFGEAAVRPASAAAREGEE
jgi:DNA polymerase-4